MLNDWLSNNNNMLLGNQISVEPIIPYNFSGEMLANMESTKNSNTTNQLKHLAIQEIITSTI